jgi:hemerythrin-like domain-containing protein
MDPFEYLGNEHRRLTEMADVLEVMTEQAARGSELDRADLAVLVDYFREFGDLGHHDKEENLLVPALIRAQLDWYDGPLADMRREHRQERYLMRALRNLAYQRDAWSPDGRARFVALAREFTAFQRAHMTMENEVLFPLARQNLSADQQAQLLADFQKFDQEVLPQSDLSLAERASQLLTKYKKS